MGAAWAALLVALGLGGCGMDKASEQARQRDTIGDVQIATTFCTGGDSDLGSHSCAPYDHPHRGQALVAYRLPDGSEAPEGFSDDGGTRAFSRSLAYAEYMQATYPEEGMHWVGFVSDVQSPPVGFGSALTVSPRFSLPRHPFAGPFPYKVVGGWRELTDPAADGGAPIDCADTGSTSCAETGAEGDDAVLATRDLAVLPGGEEPEVQAGGHVLVPFSVRMFGSGASGARLQLAASSDLNGAVLSLDESAEAGDAPVGVQVSVPTAAAPGTYSITLEATAPRDSDVIVHKGRGKVAAGGERRTGTMTFRVVAPTPPPDPQPDPSPDPSPTPGPEPTPGSEPGSDPAPSPEPSPSETPTPTPRPHVARRAKLHLSLAALPRRAYGGDSASYLVVVSNASRNPARRTRVCERLPARVQFVQATRRVTFRGRDLCFRRTRLGAGGSMAALVYVHVDTDARAGMAHASATATAANAKRVRAHARLRVLTRAAPPHRAPVTG
jgi:uncharacterized repeat protein (TIGR01451 family)